MCLLWLLPFPTMNTHNNLNSLRRQYRFLQQQNEAMMQALDTNYYVRVDLCCSTCATTCSKCNFILPVPNVCYPTTLTVQHFKDILVTGRFISSHTLALIYQANVETSASFSAEIILRHVHICIRNKLK